jgi:hypothetical protein
MVIIAPAQFLPPALLRWLIWLPATSPFPRTPCPATSGSASYFPTQVIQVDTNTRNQSKAVPNLRSVSVG